MTRGRREEPTCIVEIRHLRTALEAIETEVSNCRSQHVEADGTTTLNMAYWIRDLDEAAEHLQEVLAAATEAN